MLSIDFIRRNEDRVREAILNKGIDLSLESILDLDEKRRTLKQEVDELREKRNEITEQIKQGKDREKLIKNAKEVKSLLSDLEEKYKRVKKEYEKMMLLVPNVYSENTPVGKGEEDNVVVETRGEKPKFDFNPRNHIELGKNLDILDLRRGAKVGGYRGYYLKNEGALLHFAVIWHAIEKMREEGFTLMIPPTIVKDFAMYGTGWFPFDMDNIYKVVPAGKMKTDEKKGEGTNLAGTAEPSLCAFYADEILDKKQLPFTLCGISQCYRSEIGSYGKDTKGIYRIHEFLKAEQVVLCEGDYKVSNKWLEKLMEISQTILEDLQLPYRIVQMCTGDMGAGKYKMYDIETWMPGRDDYGETHSASNLGDWQARRLNIRYKDENGKSEFVHMLNNTAIASPRILIAILENHQQKDGSVRVPEVLQKWVGSKILNLKL